MGVMLAPAHFHEYQVVIVLHYQVDLTLAAAIITLHQQQSLLLQPLCCCIFGLLAATGITAKS